MKLIDLNRKGGIGANSMFVEIGGVRLLIDSGLNPKFAGREALPDFSPLRSTELDAIIITHCHLDHIGSLPVVMREHPRVPVIMSVPSAMLIARMLHNSVNVMERQKEEQGIPEYPLFTHGEIDALEQRFVRLPFGQVKKISAGNETLEITLHPAGHIAGAAGVDILHKHRRIFFTGDVQFDAQRTLNGARFPMGHYDTIVMETTRGATDRPASKTRAAEITRLIECINKTIDRGGSILIPVFALGRQQELLTVLNDARGFGKLVQCPIISGGLGMDIVDYFDEIARKTGTLNFNRNVVRELKVKRPSKNLIAGRDPGENALYLLSSGMVVENTPSYIVASCLAGHARNTIAFVGYSDPDTPGGKLLATSHGDKFLFDAIDTVVKLNCQVERFELSGHADRDELLEFALRREPRAIVLTHGDPPAREWFVEEFKRADPSIKVIDPVPLEQVVV
jgi:Cft2 family RNA processing exonuclease